MTRLTLAALTLLLASPIGCDKSSDSTDTSAADGGSTDGGSTDGGGTDGGSTDGGGTDGGSTDGGTTDGGSTDGGTTDGGTTDGGTTDGGTTALATYTWYADIDPLLQTYCDRCHYDGGLGTGDFTDYATASAMAEIMLAAIDAGQMPPAASDPECRDYHGSDFMFLPEESYEVLSTWVAEGTPEGDPADAVSVEAPSEELADADLTIMLEAAYTPSFSDPNQPGNEYRCFVLDPGLTEPAYVTAMQPIIDNREMVHHVVLYTVRGGASIAPEDADADGFDCINGQEFSYIDGMLGGWAPGALPVELDDGLGIRLDAGEVLIVQMHYYDSGSLTETDDHSGYAFRLADEVETEVHLESPGIYNFTIPAGDPAYTASGSDRIPQAIDLTIYSVFPHMHVLGSGFRAWVELPDGSEQCLVDSDSYDFENQQTYLFTEPVEVPGGSTVHYECTWNNSESNEDRIIDPPQDTRYGERTDEEMCFFFMLTSYE